MRALWSGARTDVYEQQHPSCPRAELSGAYVVRLRDATRRHYDLRLHVGGVLTSFAVPRGPSLDPELPLSDRRELLARVLPELGLLRAAPPLAGALAPILAFCAEHGMPSVVADKKSSPYSRDPKKTAWVEIPTGTAASTPARPAGREPSSPPTRYAPCRARASP